MNQRMKPAQPTLASLAYSVDQAYTPTLKPLNLPYFKATPIFRRRKKAPPLTGDQRINNKPDFLHRPGIDKASRRSSTPNEINVMAASIRRRRCGLLLTRTDVGSRL